MNLRSITFRNLRRRRSRVIFLVVGLLIGVATVVTLLSLTQALTVEAQNRMESFGANIIVTPKVDDLSLTYAGISLGGVTVDRRQLTERDVERIRGIPNKLNLKVVAPELIGTTRIEGKRVLLMGVEPGEQFRLKRWWTVDGRRMKDGNEVVLGSRAADALGLTMGDPVEIGGRPFTVVGILRPTGSQDDELAITSLPVAQDLLGKQGKVSMVEIAALCADCPVEDIVKQISGALPEAQVTAMQEVVKSRMHALEQFRAFGLGAAGVVVAIEALVVFVTMMASVNERTREIGIFRALGFRRGHVMRLILLEAAITSVLAGLLGYVTGMGTTWLVLPFFAESDLGIVWAPLLAAGAVGLALAVGALASIYPALHASRMDPTEALRAL